jgi:hypothetical protein
MYMGGEHIQLLKDLIRLLVPAFYIGWCIVNALVAQEKGREVGTVLGCSIVCSPFLVYLWLLAVPPKNRPS